MVGLPHIDDFSTDTTEVGSFLRDWWPVCFRELISAGDLVQFKKRENLFLISEIAGEDGLYPFTLPTGFVKFCQALTPEQDSIKYTLAEDNTLRASVKELEIEYLSDAKTDLPHLWGPIFEEAFRTLLASRLHAKFDRNNAKSAAYMKEAMALNVASQSDAGQQQNRRRFSYTDHRGHRFEW
jgi:hypothetical protein